jgi:uncharacterized membrane protein
MALDVTAEVRIDRPPDEVASYEFEPRNDPKWIGGVKTVEVLSSSPFAKGSQVLRKGGFMGRPIEWLMEVVDFEPGRRVAMHALRSPFPMDVTYELAPTDGATTAKIRVQGEARGFYGLFGPLTPVMVRRSVAGDLRRLKKLVEGSP